MTESLYRPRRSDYSVCDRKLELSFMVYNESWLTVTPLQEEKILCLFLFHCTWSLFLFAFAPSTVTMQHILHYSYFRKNKPWKQPSERFYFGCKMIHFLTMAFTNNQQCNTLVASNRTNREKNEYATQNILLLIFNRNWVIQGNGITSDARHTAYVSKRVFFGGGLIW